MSVFDQSHLAVDEQLIEKWMPVIKGEGKWEVVSGTCPKVKESHYGTMAQLLENVALQEKTTTGEGLGSYKPILIPMVRRVMPSIIGMDIFGVQPLKMPTGLVFALRATYGNDSLNPVKRANSKILILADASGLAVGDQLAGEGGGVGTLRYKEGNVCLVEVTAGAFTVGQNVDVGVGVYAAADTTVSAVNDNEALFNVIFKNYSGSYETTVGEGMSTDIKEVGFEIDTTEVKAKTRKLKAKWTDELEEDLQSQHSMNAESLLSSVASDEIIMEMNREFIDLVDTKATAGGVSDWDYDAVDGRWEMEKYHTLIAKISRVKREIAVANKRGQGNFMIVSNSVLSVLEATGKLSTDGIDPFNTAYAGTFNGMKVYVDIFAPSDQILVGYKGPSEIDAGIYYSPYIPLKVSKGFGEEDGQPRTFFKTRYGVADNINGAKNYYRKITVSNLPA